MERTYPTEHRVARKISPKPVPKKYPIDAIEPLRYHRRESREYRSFIMSARVVILGAVFAFGCCAATADAQGKKANISLFANRDPAKRMEKIAIDGPNETDLAVDLGLAWLANQQMGTGRWQLNSSNLDEKDRGTEANDIAGTALGLLPFLGVGYTHKASKHNPYDKNVAKGLAFLVSKQDVRTGYFGTSMYGHGLATLAVCEAYALTKDPGLRAPAQRAVNLLVQIQHDAGGWRYGPFKAVGDMSISGWQIMALNTARVAGLDVPDRTIVLAKNFLNSTMNQDSSYRYTAEQKPTTTTTAIGLLCRQHLEAWGPVDKRFQNGVKHLIAAPEVVDCYHCYYETQVRYNAGGDAWSKWRAKSIASMCKSQVTDPQSKLAGSWSTNGDRFGRAGGRLMVTSFNLLSLEIEYRYTPLFKNKAK